VVSREYADTTTKDVFYYKKARCSVSGSLLFTSLKKPSIVPSGVIMMWSGSIASIPVGWALCDGTNGTPNLSGRFLVGYNPTDPDHNVIGAIGGEKMHTLTIDEIPSHSHGYVGTGTVATASGTASNRQCGDFAKATNPAGGGLPHENRPPYYTIAYIQKL
jgi:microcystin-dependent protein